MITCVKLLRAHAFLTGYFVLSALIWCTSSVPQPKQISAEVRQGSGAFLILTCVVPEDCSDTSFVLTGLPAKGQLFKVQGSPSAPISTFKRSELIKVSGEQLTNRIVYYLPYHEVLDDSITDTVESDVIKFQAYLGSIEAQCLIQIRKQPLLPIGGGSGYSLLFDGIDDVVVTPVDGWFPTHAFTIMLWIRVYDKTKQATIFTFFGAKAPVFEISNPGNLTCIVGFEELSPSNIDVSDGKWHHIAAIWSSFSRTCQFIVDSNISSIASASKGIPDLESRGTIVLGNRQACDILDPTEMRTSEVRKKISKHINLTPNLAHGALNFSLPPSSLLKQHMINRAHGNSVPAPSIEEDVSIEKDLHLNARQRSDYQLCRCTGGCFHPSLAFYGELDDVRLYSLEKTMPEIRVESRHVFLPIKNTNVTRPQLEQQFFGLDLWLTFDDIIGVIIPDASGHNRTTYLGSSAEQRFPCHKKREPYQIVSSTGVLGGSSCFISIGRSLRTEIKLPGIVGIGNKNQSLIPKIRFNKKSGGGLFYHAACGYTGNLAVSMLAQQKSLVGPTGCIIYVPNQGSLTQDVVEYSISNANFPTQDELNSVFVEISYNISFFRESGVIPANYLVGLQAETISVVKLMITRTDFNRLSMEVTALPEFANVWIPIESRCADIPECQRPINTTAWETSGSSFIDASSMFSTFPDWKYVRPPFATSLYESGPQVCNTDQYLTPEALLPSKVCKVGKYYLNASIFNRNIQGGPLFLEFSKWEWAMWELIDFSRQPYGGANENQTLQGVVVECMIFDGSYQVPADNCTCCYISNCFPPNGLVVEQSELPSTPAAVLRAVINRKLNKLRSLLALNAQFDRAAINSAAALGRVDMLRELFSQGSPKWDHDAIDLASSFGYQEAVDYLKTRTSMQGFEGYRTGSKCLVRGALATSLSGFVTTVPYVLASGMIGVSGQLGSLKLRWSKPELTDMAPNFPASREQTISFWGLLSQAPKPDGSDLLKNGIFHGFQNEPVVIETSNSMTNNSLNTCSRAFIVSQPRHGDIYNMDDSFGIEQCSSLTLLDDNFNQIQCREFGKDVYFFDAESSQSPYVDSPIRPIVYPKRIVSPIFKPVSGLKIQTQQEYAVQAPIGILNASTNKNQGPRIGKDGGREDLVLLESIMWSNNLEYGRIGSKSNASFYATCGELGFEHVAFRFAKKVFPSEFSFISTIDKSSKIRILAKAPPKRSQTRNFVQGNAPSSRLVSSRIMKNISEFEFEMQSTSFMKPESLSLMSWQYVTADTNEAWIELWEGFAENIAVQNEPMKHKVIFCHDSSFSWLETDTILLEVCGLKNAGVSFSDPGPQLTGVCNVQLHGTRGGSPRGLVQSLRSRFVYMPHSVHFGEDSLSVHIKDSSTGLSSQSQNISIKTTKRRSPVAAANIEIVAPFNHSLVVTLTGFTFSEPLDSYNINNFPSKVILKQFDGSVLDASGESRITDNLNRIIVSIHENAAGLTYDVFEYSAGVQGTNTTAKGKVTVHVFCRSATYYNSTLNRCLPCPEGTFGTKMGLSTSCEPCLAGTDSREGSIECTPCPVGYFAQQGALCSKCPQGTHSPIQGLHLCIDCPRGTFNRLNASSSCEECGNMAYTETNRSVSCETCPKLTLSNSKVSKSVLECKCTEGAYQPRGEAGKECVQCPAGAYCHGDLYPPVTRTHYWTSHAEWSSIEEPEYFLCDHRGVRNACLGFPQLNRVELLARCAHRAVPELCEMFPTFPTIIFGNASAADDRKCWRGYTGRICSSCSDGYYKYPGGACVECPISILIPLNIAIVIVSVILIASASASPVITIYISVSNFQNLVLLNEFGLSHPPALATIWSILAVFNTNFELFPFQCILGSAYDWVKIWIFEVFLLPLILGICVGRWIGLYLMYRPMLKDQVSRFLKQSRPTSLFPVNSHGLYRPSRPSTPSTKSSDSLDMKRNHELSNVANDLADAGIGIEADIYEDDSESTIQDTDHYASRVRKPPSVRPLAAIARTGLVSAHSIASTAASSVDLQNWQGLSQDELDFYLDCAVWIACFVLDHFYYFGSLATLRALVCRFWNSKTSVLNSNPNIDCGGALHNSLLGISTPMLLTNVALLPCGLLAVLTFGIKHQKLQNVKFIKRWGFIFERYEQEYYWWHAVVVGRKLLLALIASAVFSDPYLQSALSCIVLSVNIILNLALRPFREEQHGTLDSLLMLLTMLAYSFTMMNPTDIIELSNRDSSRESGIVCAQLIIIGLFISVSLHHINADLKQTEHDLPTWIVTLKRRTWDPATQIVSKVCNEIKAVVLKKMQAKRHEIAESNTVRLSRIRSAVRKDVERENSKKSGEKKKSVKREIELTKWNRHLTDADVDIRRWDAGDVLTEQASWRTSKFDIRKRVFILERLLRDAAIHDSKSPKILNLEREITTALKVCLQTLRAENQVVYESLYDTEAECDALEQEKNALELRMAAKEQRITEASEKNAFLNVRLNLKALGLSDESEWKEKLTEEQHMRKKLEVELLQLQLKMKNYTTEL